MVAAMTPLPLREREGPAAVRRWEGEGTTILAGSPITSGLALTLPCSAWAPPSPETREG